MVIIEGNIFEAVSLVNELGGECEMTPIWVTAKKLGMKKQADLAKTLDSHGYDISYIRVGLVKRLRFKVR